MRSKISMFKRILSAALVMALLIGVLPMSIFSLGIVDTDSKIVDPNTMNEWENFFGRTDTAYAGAVWTDKSVFRDASAFADVNKLATGAGTAITVGQNNFLVALSAIASTSVVKGYSTTPTDTMLVLDGDSLETAQNITLTSDADAKSPMRLLFEVGLKDGINPVTVKELMAGTDHKHENADGSYSFYSNRWAVTDLNDPNNPIGHRVTTAHFEPSKENEYYHFKEAETVLDANGNAVTQLDTSGNAQYYYDRQVVSNTTGTTAEVTKDAVTGELKAAYQVNGTAVQDVKVTFTNGYEDDTIPETGDNFRVVLMSNIMLMSLAALAVLVLNRRKEF